MAMTTGQKISECRKKLGLSQEALGEKMGVSRQAISKWESDSALPEIEKLIGLSKLFEVNVGWLLGVEELHSGDAPKAEVSEELLHKIEQIVLRYRPRKEKLSTGRKVLIGAVIAVILLLGYSFYTQWQITRNEVGYLAAQVRNNNEQNAMILAQLDGLEDQIAEPVEPKAVALTSYEFELEGGETDDAVTLHFHAVPSHWHEDYNATLVAEHNKKEYLSQRCSWGASGLRSTLKMDIQNGYSYYLLVEFPDGSKEQTRLFDTEAENIRQVFTILIEVTQGTGEFNLAANTLTLDDYTVYMEPPLYSGGQYVGLQEGSLILYRVRGGVREEADTYSLFGKSEFSGEPGEVSSIECYPYGPFTLPQLQDGDGLELWVCATSSNGIEEKQLITSWAYAGGEFIGNIPVSE